ncbi:hypothetical protein BDZ91DRAFT_729991 [Kalaharituber pfeilii]|nr:hypothetical protein BDZ91DRAFT_729991 [Kalaharituber pfeilii]
MLLLPARCRSVKDQIRSQGGKITHEYTLIKSFRYLFPLPPPNFHFRFPIIPLHLYRYSHRCFICSAFFLSLIPLCANPEMLYTRSYELPTGTITTLGSNPNVKHVERDATYTTQS